MKFLIRSNNNDRRGVENLLKCVEVTKKFRSFTAVDHITFEIMEGEIVGFLGPNGAGKSTTIRMLMGLTSPSEGTVELMGKNPAENYAIRHEVGYCPVELRLDDQLTIGQTLDTWSRIRGNIDRQWLGTLIERFEIDIKKNVRSLSTGNRRKVGLVGAFLAKPRFLVLDEPTNGLDPLMQQVFKEVLSEAIDNGATVLLSSHVLSEIENIAQRVIAIRSGKIVADSPIDNFLPKDSRDVEVIFEGAPRVQALTSLEGVENVSVNDSTVHFSWQGNPAPLLTVLHQSAISSLKIKEPDLENVLLNYYRTTK